MAVRRITAIFFMRENKGRNKSRCKNAQIVLVMSGKIIFFTRIDTVEFKHYTYRTSLQYIVVEVFGIQDYVQRKLERGNHYG